MSLQTLSEWLRCPNCFLPLDPTGTLALACPSGHHFDVNRRGYVTLITGTNKFIGDSAVMLDARDRFQGAGFYSPLREAVSRLVAAERPHRVIDMGCGSGYYLRAALAAATAPAPSRDLQGAISATATPPRALAMDLSAAAVARTVRSGRDTDGLVADVWSPLPIRDGAAELLLNVFAPRNAAEFHRVLVPHGLLLVVIPQQSHLHELRAAGRAVSMQADKARHLIDGLADYFELERQERLSAIMSLSPSEVDSVLGMGPSSHHVAAGAVVEVDAATDVTAAFDIFSFRRRAR